MKQELKNYFKYQYEEEGIWYNCELIKDFLNYAKGQKFLCLYVDEKNKILRLMPIGHAVIEIPFIDIMATVKMSDFYETPVDWKEECMRLMGLIDNHCGLDTFEIHKEVRKEYVSRRTNRTQSILNSGTM